MSHVLYAYIAKPEPPQVAEFFRALSKRGALISHLGKKDPPKKFSGTVEEATALVFTGTELTLHTFGRDAARKINFDIQIRRDPRWTHSTVSVSRAASDDLDAFAQAAIEAFDLLLAVRGVLGGSKDQTWRIAHLSANCPKELRAKFAL